MLSFIALIIPLVFSIILFIGWSRKVVWWEFLLLFVTSFIAVGIVKLVADYSNTQDTEYWSGTKNEVRYYEDWNERVPCRHPEYCTRYDPCCTRDSKGNCEGCTETYQCGWEHAYDVDYHPEHYDLITSIGEYSISRNEFYRLVEKFGNKTFVDLHRDYHTNDGDMYSSVWKGENEKLEIVTQEHTYENRVQSSKSVFNYPEVTPDEIKRHGIYDYPSIDGDNHQRHILGLNNPKGEHHMDILNGRLGPKKQLASFILIFKNKTIRAAELQEAYWKGGNKNEFNVCIGIDKSGKIQWCKIFSWSEVAEPKITIRNFIMEQDSLDIPKIADFMYDELSQKFIRKKFRDFNYLSIEMTSGQILAAVITTIILDILVAIFVILNEFVDTSGNTSSRINWSAIGQWFKRIGQWFKDKYAQVIKWFKSLPSIIKSWFNKK